MWTSSIKKGSKPQSKHRTAQWEYTTRARPYLLIYKVIDLYLSCKLTFVYNPIAFVIFIYCAHCIRSLNHLQRSTLLPLFLVIRLAKWDIATVLSQSLSQGNHSLLNETIKTAKLTVAVQNLKTSITYQGFWLLDCNFFISFLF